MLIECLGTVVFFFQAEDGIRDLVRSRGLGDVYKRQISACAEVATRGRNFSKKAVVSAADLYIFQLPAIRGCLLYTSDAADERSSVDLGGRRIIKKKKKVNKQLDDIVNQ